MHKTIELEGKEVLYTLRLSTRARQMRLSIYPGAGLVVTIPERLSLAQAQRFLVQKSSWILDKLGKQKVPPSYLLPLSSKRDYVKYKDAALQLAQRRIAHFNCEYGFRIGRISIRNQKTRWGSCSHYGDLTFNYKIALLPPHLADYIIVHELCHRGEMNHSKKFWDLVARTIPDHKKIRAELRRGGVLLS